MAVSPNELRKQVGCWACENCKITNQEINATVSCGCPDETVRQAFAGWETAQTCKGFRMKAYDVNVVERQ